MCPWKWVPGISPGVKAAGAYGWRPTTLVVPNVKKIRGLNLPGTPWACSGLLRDDLYRWFYYLLYYTYTGLYSTSHETPTLRMLFDWLLSRENYHTHVGCHLYNDAATFNVSSVITYELGRLAVRNNSYRAHHKRDRFQEHVTFHYTSDVTSIGVQIFKWNSCLPLWVSQRCSILGQLPCKLEGCSNSNSLNWNIAIKFPQNLTILHTKLPNKVLNKLFIIYQHIPHHIHTHTHTHTHTPNQELHMLPHLPTFYHNNTLLYCILSFY
jgi:hypothetical protein